MQRMLFLQLSDRIVRSQAGYSAHAAPAPTAFFPKSKVIKLIYDIFYAKTIDAIRGLEYNFYVGTSALRKHER